MPELIKDGKKIIALAQNGLEFYPVQEKNGSIEFNGKKYSQSDPLIGKKFNITVNDVGRSLEISNTNFNLGGSPGEQIVENVLEYKGDKYVIFQDNSDDIYKLSDIAQFEENQNGGENKPLLTHIYRALAQFVTSEMEMA